MKSRISFFNATAFKKNITRYAPLWAIYIIGGLLVMLTVLAGLESRLAGKTLANTIGPFSIINMIYAAICAQLLFGDLYNSRLCNALHAMPLRRETWFFTHIASGFAFSLVPHIVGALVMMPLLGENAFVAFFWLAGMTLEYIFFFGLAVFSVFCTGNRLGMVAVYGILNFASIIAYWFVYTIYEPMLLGVSISEDIFCLLSPVVQMVRSQLLKFVPVNESVAYYMIQYRLEGFGEGWGYLGICAGIGVALMGLALLLYRRRKLECAGDFIAVKQLEPIFTAAFTLCTGCVFAFVGELFASDYLVFLIVGLILGWFISRMLLRRTVKVFRWKSFGYLAIFLAVLGATLVLTWLDPVGITRWVPEKDAVAQVEINFGDEVNGLSYDYVKVEDPAQIEKIIQGHQAIVDNRGAGTGRCRDITFRYTLKNGTVAERSYIVYYTSVMGKALDEIYSLPENLLGYDNKEQFKAAVKQVYFTGWSLEELCNEYNKASAQPVAHKAVLDELLEDIWMDCLAGHLSGNFSPYGGKGYIEMDYAVGAWRNVRYTDESAYILAWMEKYEELLNLNIYAK